MSHLNAPQTITPAADDPGSSSSPASSPSSPSPPSSSSSAATNSSDEPTEPFRKPPRTGLFAKDKLHLLKPKTSQGHDDGSQHQGPGKGIRDSHNDVDDGSVPKNQGQDHMAVESTSKEDEEKLTCSYVLHHIIYFFWGIACLAITLTLHLVEPNHKKIFWLDPFKNGSSTLVPVIFMYWSNGLKVLAGIWGFIAFFGEMKQYTFVIRHFLWIVLALDMFAAIFSYSTWKDSDLLQYKRLLEAEAFKMSTGDSSYLKLWPKEYWGFWDTLQVGFECCGFNDVQDWVQICNCVPKSCCHKRKERERFSCESVLEQLNSRANTTSHPIDLKHARNYIYQEGCEKNAMLEFKSLQRDWILFPLLIGLFDLIFMIHGTQLVFEFRAFMKTSNGARTVSQFRRNVKCCLWLRHCCLWFKKRRHRSHVHSTSSGETQTVSSCDICQATSVSDTAAGSPCSMITSVQPQRTSSASSSDKEEDGQGLPKKLADGVGASKTRKQHERRSKSISGSKPLSAIFEPQNLDPEVVKLKEEHAQRQQERQAEAKAITAADLPSLDDVFQHSLQGQPVAVALIPTGNPADVTTVAVKHGRNPTVKPVLQSIPQPKVSTAEAKVVVGVNVKNEANAMFKQQEQEKELATTKPKPLPAPPEKERRQHHHGKRLSLNNPILIIPPDPKHKHRRRPSSPDPDLNPGIPAGSRQITITSIPVPQQLEPPAASEIGSPPPETTARALNLEGRKHYKHSHRKKSNVREQ